MQNKFNCKHLECDMDGCYCGIKQGGSFNHCVLPFEQDYCKYFDGVSDEMSEEMGYKSPISIVHEEIRESMNVTLEDSIYKAVERVGIDIDKEELVKALQYDRDQYEKGYADGKKEAAREILQMFYELIKERYSIEIED